MGRRWGFNAKHGEKVWIDLEKKIYGDLAEIMGRKWGFNQLKVMILLKKDVKQWIEYDDIGNYTRESGWIQQQILQSASINQVVSGSRPTMCLVI